MSGINTGILRNASPLSADAIAQLEKQVLETNTAYAYLDQAGKLCFAVPHSVNVIRKLAWNNAYELTTENNVLIKKVYKKDSLKSYYLSDTFTKDTYVDVWLPKGVRFLTRDNLILLDSNGLLLTAKGE